MFERFHDVSPEVEAIVRAAYDRMQAEWSKITVGEVVKLLVDMETKVAAVGGVEYPVWDEYLSANSYEKGGKYGSYLHERYVDRIGESYRWIGAYVVVGGSEGMYLHVDVINGEGQLQRLLVGKSLSKDGYWPELWLSAMRIQYVLTLGS